MISKYNHKELNWVDMESPKEEEINHIIEEYSIPSDIKNKIISKDLKDIIDINYNYIFTSMNSNLLFFVSDQIVLSIHNGHKEAFDKFSKEIELDALKDNKINNHYLLFAYLLKNLYIDSQKQAELNADQIATLQNHMKNIHKAKRNLIIIVTTLIILLIIFIWL